MSVKPTPLLLAVLVLLWEAPMHPYQIRRLMTERSKELFADIKTGSIYHAVQRLERAGLATAVETSREGNRPERTTYRITDLGNDTCREWIRTLIAEPGHDFPDAIAAIASLPVLTTDEAREVFLARAAALESELDRLRQLDDPQIAQLPRVVLLDGEYARTLRTAELEWLRSVVAAIDDGSLHWDLSELAKLATEQ